MNQQAAEIKRQYTLLGLLWLGFVAVALLLQISDGMAWASLHVGPTLDGQWWRLLTAHLTHLDWPHWAMNMLGLSLCLLVFRSDLHPGHWLASFVFISLLSSLGLLLLYAPEQRYVGFSDVLHGWILIGAAAIAGKERKLAIAVFVLFWLKIAEENSGLTFFTSTAVSGSVAKESHILGAVAGMLYAALFLRRQWWPGKRCQPPAS